MCLCPKIACTVVTGAPAFKSSGAAVMAQNYAPYGDVLESYGAESSSYGFAGEWTDGTGLQYLRARYLNTGIGRFISRDTWGGDYRRPMSLNRWGYVEGNPVNRVDPSGFFPWVPSEWTARGRAIHKMIQAQYMDKYYFGDVQIERAIPKASKSGLRVSHGVWQGILGKNYGFADIIDLGSSEIYEIKPEKYRELGNATVYWYILAWEFAVADGLIAAPLEIVPGTAYPSVPVIVGTDPNNSLKWVMARLSDPGVILYWVKNKNDTKVPIPIYVFEYEPETKTAKKKKYEPAYQPVYASVEISKEEAIVVVGAPVLIWCIDALRRLFQASICVNPVCALY